MAPRGRLPPQEALLLQKLINDWKVDFESVTTPDEWDAGRLPCKHIFEQILEIKSITFTDYPRVEHSDREAANQKKLLVRRLQANVARCRREKDNEAGWINNVASLVFENLDGFEFRWLVKTG